MRFEYVIYDKVLSYNRLVKILEVILKSQPLHTFHGFRRIVQKHKLELSFLIEKDKQRKVIHSKLYNFESLQILICYSVLMHWTGDH